MFGMSYLNIVGDMVCFPSWNEDDDSPFKWDGVRCNSRSNRVSDLVLDGFELSGKMGRLSDLRVIDLSENSLSGSVPSGFFDQCGSLRSISLAGNKFTGLVPDSLGKCSSLGAFNVSGVWSLNRLREESETGVVPDEIGACALLRSIDLSENSFSGSLPSTLQKLSLCNELDFHGNLLADELSECIGEMGSLQTVDLSKNMFSGAVPSVIEFGCESASLKIEVEAMESVCRGHEVILELFRHLNSYFAEAMDSGCRVMEPT
ncbi:Leucine-rich repeat-containing protein [Artemisia annua]|uniref:Leucine-rich repeat-containing protein n=1 Tax=Artemisia annua TaxID=35608 RepID=A0A2U1MPS1_ARTAN|nr:Leucine-rich repeat-containing protein [Artemisia annua]